MGMIWFLKALADISVYYAFAAPVAAYFGCTALVWCGLLQAGAYAIARSSKHKWLLSLSLAAVAASYYLCRESPAGLIFQTPALAYLIWQYAIQAQLPELLQQREDYVRLWKLLLPAVLPGIFLSTLSALIAPVLMVFAAGAALLRTLRHNPETYLRPHFQLINLGTLLCVSLTAFLLGSGPVVNTVGSGIRWFYQELLVPFLMWLLYLPGQLMQWIIDLLRPLMNIEPDVLEATISMETVADTQSVPPANYDVPPAWDVIELILLIALGVVALIAMFLLFRKLGRGGPSTAQREESLEVRTTAARSRDRAAAADTPSVQSVRKHYRRYLKLCVKSGVPVEPSSTSGDVRDSAMERKALQPHAGRIRQIYIQARYAGLATKEDVKEIAVLCAESKKEK